MLVEKQAVCHYCGKQRFVNVEDSVSEDELNHMAEETCDCTAAKMARGMKQTDAALYALLGPESREKSEVSTARKRASVNWMWSWRT